MLQSTINNSQVTGVPIDLRAPTSTRFRKGDWWKRLVILLTLDSILISIAWLLVYVVFEQGTNNQAHLFFTYLSLQLIALAIQGNYAPGRQRHNYWRLIKTITFAHCVPIVVQALYTPNSQLNSQNLTLYWLTSTSLICLGRLSVEIALEYARKNKILGFNSVYIICSETEREQATNCVQQETRYNIVGCDDSVALDKEHRLATLEKLNQLGVTEVFISLTAIQNRLYLCWLFQTSGITVHLLPMELKPIDRDLVVHNVGGLTCLSFMSPAITGKDFWLKRIFDICFAIVFLIITSPIYLAIAIAIVIDSPGSPFYRQTRVGLHGKEFKVWKFRTMRNDADKMQKELEALNETKDGILFKIKDDPRVTRVGKILRLYSLDELPQLFNVVLGEMSLVGPRPLPTRDVNKFSARHLIRQEVLPGVTGMWQVSGRSDIVDFEQVLNLDLKYIENWSLWLDFQILWKTVDVVVNKKGAY
ncbi:MAG: sugar transferase [Nostocales cyanobacterium]|nr:MAG: sugar transferase [Nostocales cyanobacterium]TAF16648.1 MAG: sugar transferase [Nostocales cyanobacterium]